MGAPVSPEGRLSGDLLRKNLPAARARAIEVVDRAEELARELVEVGGSLSLRALQVLFFLGGGGSLPCGGQDPGAGPSPSCARKNLSSDSFPRTGDFGVSSLLAFSRLRRPEDLRRLRGCRVLCEAREASISECSARNWPAEVLDRAGELAGERVLGAIPPGAV